MTEVLQEEVEEYGIQDTLCLLFTEKLKLNANLFTLSVTE